MKKNIYICTAILMEFTQSLGSSQSPVIDCWFILKMNQHWNMVRLNKNVQDEEQKISSAFAEHS